MKKNFWILWIACLLIFGGSLYWYYANLEKKPESNIQKEQVLVEKKNIQENSEAYRISVEYPVFQGGQVGRANALIQAKIEKDIQNFKEGVKELYEIDIRDLSDDIKSELTITYEMSYVSDEFVSMKFETFSYTRGSAHPLTLHSGFSYSWKDNEEITLSSIFLNDIDTLSALSKKTKEKLKSMLGDMYVEDFAETGLEPKEENFKEFYISKEGITFIFNVYQVAPYAAGPQFVLLSWDEISHMFNL